MKNIEQKKADAKQAYEMTITDKENGMKWKIKRIDDNSFLVTC